MQLHVKLFFSKIFIKYSLLINVYVLQKYYIVDEIIFVVDNRLCLMSPSLPVNIHICFVLPLFLKGPVKHQHVSV